MPTFTPTPRFEAAIRAFDAANALDPNRETADGVEQPREMLYARRLTRWVLRLAPNASEALLLAARCQHLRRWEIPRSAYPADRPGYLRWRRELQAFHARESAAILEQAGYGPEIIERVQALNLKRDLGRDAEMQGLEDALCLVFLEFQLEELATRTEDEKLINALRKSWGKMSERGRAEARKLNLGDRAKALLERALASDEGQAS